MKYFFEILSNHKWAILFAIIIGLIIAFPQAYFRYDHQDIYQGIDISKTDGEAFYMSRIQEVRDGNFGIGNSVSAQGKDFPFLWTPLSEIIASGVGQVFFLDIKNTVLLERFLFPAFIFLLIYALVYQLFKRKLTALIASVTVLLLEELLIPQVLFNLLFRQQVHSESFLIFSQLISPATHLLFFFGFLLCFWLFLEKEKRIYGYLSALILGLSFYSYPYTWTFIYAFLGVMILIFIFQKKWIDIKNIIFIYLGSLIVALPYFYNLYYLINHPLYSEASLRFGMIETHFPLINITILLLLGLFLLFFPREKTKRYYFSLALVLTPFVVLNQQIITGRAMLPGHYHWYFIKPLTGIFLIIIIFYQLERIIKYNRWQKMIRIILISLILLIFFGNGILIQRNSYLANQEFQLQFQNQSPIFEWLNNNTQKDEVVLTNPEISYLLPVYTHLNPVLGCVCAYHLVSEESLLEGMFLEYRFDGLKGEQVFKRFLEDKKLISSRIYGQYYRRNFGGLENIPKEKLQELTDQYQEFLNIDLFDILDKYSVKYIIWDTINHPNWQLDQYSFLRKVFESNNIVIYQYEK